MLLEHKQNSINLKSVKTQNWKKLPKIKCSELMSALLQITMETEETTERVKAPTVPSWKRSPSPIFVSAKKPNQLQQQKFNKETEKESNKKRIRAKNKTLKMKWDFTENKWKGVLWFGKDLDRIKSCKVSKWWYIIRIWVLECCCEFVMHWTIEKKKRRDLWISTTQLLQHFTQHCSFYFLSIRALYIKSEMYEIILFWLLKIYFLFLSYLFKLLLNLSYNLSPWKILMFRRYTYRRFYENSKF